MNSRGFASAQDADTDGIEGLTLLRRRGGELRAHVAGRDLRGNRELPDALVLHDHQKERSTWLFYYQIRNRWHFMLKNYQWRTLILILPCLLIHEPLQAVRG